MDIRPQDLPELRAQLAQQFRDPDAAQRMFPKGSDPTGPDLQDVGRGFAEITEQAEMFHVSEGMAALAAKAAETLERFPLHHEDVPCDAGLIVFDGATPYESRHDCACTTELRGIAWYVHAGGVFVIPAVLTHGHHHRGRSIEMDFGMFFRIEFNDNVQEVRAAEEGPFFNIFGLLLTAWLLMQQTLARTEQMEPDRPTRRRLRRIGAEPGSVRVITLRRPKSSSEPGESDREYHHQWIVRGHWRNHWHPKRQVHRPVWIAPHIKGPEGAPLIGGEKVYALKR